MFDLETGRFVFKEGKEVYPGMKIEDFKNTKLYEENVGELYKSEENEIYYPLRIEKITGFEVEITLHFSSYNNYLKHIYIEKNNWRTPPLFDISIEKSKTGKQNNCEYENSVLNYLYRFIAKQTKTSFDEVIKEMGKLHNWGQITNNFVPYGCKHPELIQLEIEYSTVKFTHPNLDLKGMSYTEIIEMAEKERRLRQKGE